MEEQAIISQATTDQPAVEVVVPDLMDYQKAKVRIDKLITSWNGIKDQAKSRRLERYINLDVKQLRASGEIDEDETFIPQRIIDSNILRDKADAMNFLNASKRLAYFRCIDDPTVDARQLETDVTKGLTYEDWYKTFDRHYDGAALHGWDSIEILFDASKPLHVSHEHIGHDKLFFSLEVENIQDSELVVREYQFTSMRLESFVTELGFEKTVVDTMLQKNQDAKRDDSKFVCYKVYFKLNKCVYIAWHTKESQVNNWLKAPEKLRCGILQPPAPVPPPSIGSGMMLGNTPNASIMPEPQFTEADVPLYPIFVWVYRDDEQEAITEHKGRGFLDLPQQEAVTALTTAYVNGSIRAANVYASPKEDNGENAHKLEELTLENGTVVPTPIEFFNMPYPDPGMLQGLQFLDMANSKQTGKMAVAVSNRKDSRKTAEELSQASGEQQKLTSVNLATYSEYLRKILNFSWIIIQSQALAGTIQLCTKEVIEPTLMVPGQAPLGQTTKRTNNVELISKTFDVRAAGDVDVIQAELTINAFMQDWPVMQGIPGLSLVFLEEFIRLRYPLYAEKFIAAMKAGDVAKQLIQQLLIVLQGSLQPEEIKAIGPGGQKQLQDLVMNAQAYITQGGAAGAGADGQPQQQAAAAAA